VALKTFCKYGFENSAFKGRTKTDKCEYRYFTQKEINFSKDVG